MRRVESTVLRTTTRMIFGPRHPKPPREISSDENNAGIHNFFFGLIVIVSINQNFRKVLGFVQVLLVEAKTDLKK